MPLHAEDLPKHLRDKLGLPGKQRGAGRNVTGGGRWTCHSCPHLKTFTTWAAVLRHEEQTGHHRYDVELPPRSKPST